MTSLLNQLDTADAEAAEAQKLVRQNANASYRQILERADHPEPEDAALLPTLLDTLGLTMADFRKAVEMSGEVREYRTARENAAASIGPLAEECDAALADVKRLEPAYHAAQQRLRSAQGDMDAARQNYTINAIEEQKLKTLYASILDPN